ncbi:MMPL family transporter [Bacillus sp. FJAT-27245]|uniref:MMPL family transporter n=1 Tax=Bacillus sp. FJAT-27245 TaxID=1684144 RepID=UPI000A8E8771
MKEKLWHYPGGKYGRWITLFSWIALLAILNLAFPQANSQKTETAGDLGKDAPSQLAKAIADSEFPADKGIPALLAWHRGSGLETNDLHAIQTVVKKLSDHPASYQESIPPFHQLPPEALRGMVSQDGTTLIIPVSFQEDAGPEDLEKGIGEIERTIKGNFVKNPLEVKAGTENELLARITGPAGISLDANKLFSQGDLSLLFGTVAIVLILLLVIYRSPILALVPLIGVGIAYGIISPVLGWVGENGWAEFDSQGLSIMTVLLFGAGTDYCLFLISSYRSHLEKEKDKFTAMRLAISSSSGAIAMSGLTVVFSLLALLLAKYGSIHRFAIPFSL